MRKRCCRCGCWRWGECRRSGRRKRRCSRGCRRWCRCARGGSSCCSSRGRGGSRCGCWRASSSRCCRGREGGRSRRCKCCRRGSCWSRSGRRRGTGVSDFQAISENAHSTGESCGWASGACLDSACFPASTISSHPIDDIKEARVILVEHHFKVCCAASARISCPPFNVKPPVGCRPYDRSEHTAATRESRAVRRYLIGEEIALKRKNGPVPTRIWQGQTAKGRLERCA